jgi:hypothetical protein
MAHRLNDKSYTVYIHKNKINGKRYIGITSQTVNNRWRNGKGYERQTYFYNAIQKYGWDNFYHYIIITDITKEKASNLEIKLIKYYNSQNPKYGYNIAKGGELGCSNEVYVYNRVTGDYINSYINIPLASRNLNVSTSAISAVATGKAKYSGIYYFSYKYIGQKIAKEFLFNINYEEANLTPIAQYDFNGNLINIFYKERDAIIKMFGEKSKKLLNVNNKTCYGYIWIPFNINETPCEKLSETELTSRLTYNYKGCYQYDLNGKFIRRFNTITEACISIGKTKKSISRLSNKAKNIGKYENYYWSMEHDTRVEYGKDLDMSIVESKTIPKFYKKVYQYNYNGFLLNTYISIADAARKNNFNEDYIFEALKGNRVSYKNCIWRYEETEFSLNDLYSIVDKSRGLRFAKIEKDTNSIIKIYRLDELRKEFKTNNMYKEIKKACITNEICENYKWKIA